MRTFVVTREIGGEKECVKVMATSVPLAVTNAVQRGWLATDIVSVLEVNK